MWITDDIEKGFRVRMSMTKAGHRGAIFYYRHRDRNTKKLVNTKMEIGYRYDVE